VTHAEHHGSIAPPMGIAPANERLELCRKRIERQSWREVGRGRPGRSGGDLNRMGTRNLPRLPWVG